MAKGFVTDTTDSGAELSEVMRSCGGAVQGLSEARELHAEARQGALSLNRADDGFVFFDCGTWTQAPTRLNPTDAFDLLCTPDSFGISLSVAHDGGTRRRLDVAFVEARL